MSKGLEVDKVLAKDKKKQRETWSQTKRVGDKTQEINVEKLDNEGYLITISKSWTDPKTGWQHEDSKIYSEVNPLDKDESDNPIDQVASMLVRGENK
jgi:hypothetical protein